ncbi:MAG: Fic family protein [Lentisphaeraceae bacterium]|nr:Fic family protein [Lentisphaeraceae bacterium]
MTDKYWNWQQDDWPEFSYEERVIEKQERQFLINSGLSFGISRHLDEDEKKEITIDLIMTEAFKTSEIEGELLDRDSLQSSIKRHFGYKVPLRRNNPQENGISEMMIDLHHNFDTPLTHELLWNWHSMLMNGRRDLNDIGAYRTHKEPMQVISGYMHNQDVHFEAPPSNEVFIEMEQFIVWFNKTAPEKQEELTALKRAAITHLYFLSIHPFEDGNGRIGRALVEKVLAQHLAQPTLIALSYVIQEKKSDYYDTLETQNKHNQIDNWLIYFAATVLKAQDHTISEMEFLMWKASFFSKFNSQMNERQKKAIIRIFQEGTTGFQGGLSAKNYMSITRTSPSTASRDLHDLVEKGILRQEGERKSTRYWLTVINKNN